jgi:hypothetical protein
MRKVIKKGFGVDYSCSMKNVDIKHISNLHNNSFSSLTFYEQELDILKKRLQEIAAKNTGREVSRGIEHFQREFIVHGKKIDALKRAFHETLQKLQMQLLDTSGRAEVNTLELNEKLYNDYLAEERMLNDVCLEFLRFAVKWT